MRIALLAKPGHENSGVGRYTIQLRAALEALGHIVLVVHPTVPLPHVLVRIVQKLLGWNLSAFFNNYPIWASYPKADVYHLTSQNLATLMMLCRPPGKTVITVHDIIPWLSRDDHELTDYHHKWQLLFDRIALRGIMRADALIAVSLYTKATLQQELGNCANGMSPGLT